MRSQGAEAGRAGRRPRRLSLWQEVAVLLVVALVVSLVIKTFFVQAFYIPSGSMEPGLVLNDRIMVEKPSYWLGGTPERGDVVVFEDPGGWLQPGADTDQGNLLVRALSAIGLYPSGGHLVKRVVAVEGDMISCCDDQGRVLVNGVPLDSAEFIRNDTEECQASMVGCAWETGPVPAGMVFVLGDHRDDSADSTVHLCLDSVTDCVAGREYVPVDAIVGKVAARIWPPSRVSLLHRPEAFEDLD